MQTFALAELPEDCDSWDFVDDEDLLLSFSPVASNPLHPRRDLGPLPSAEEAADATRLLQDSVNECCNVSLGEGNALVGSTRGSNSEVSASAARLVAAARANAARNRGAVVSKALHLFACDESMQRVVRSLACDSSVWQAVSSNPEVRRLLSGPKLPAEASSARQQSGVQISEQEPLALTEDDSSQLTPSALSQVLQQMLHRFMDLKASILSVLSRLFGLSQETDGGDENDDEGNKHLMPGIVALVVLVIGIIVLKRPILV